MTTTISPGPSYRRGDVALVIFPNSNLRTAKTRPALIIQRDDLDSRLSQVIVCMITSKTFRAKNPSRVSIPLASPEGQESGLLTDSVVMTDNIATIATSEIDRVIGKLQMTNIDLALRFSLAL